MQMFWGERMGGVGGDVGRWTIFLKRKSSQVYVVQSWGEVQGVMKCSSCFDMSQ